MKRITTTVLAIAMFLLLAQSNANAGGGLSGNKTIPGDYPTVASAINDLNGNGVGAGGVTFNIAPGYTETIPAGGYKVEIVTNLPTVTSPVVFQRSGAGTNPKLQTDAGGSGIIAVTTLGSYGDAIIELVGTDYITFSNIDFVENYTGTSQTLRTEFGIVMLRRSSTDGCKYVTITGCTILQQQTNTLSLCIAALSRDTAGTTTNATTISGRHEHISIQGCTLNNSYNGMWFIGSSSSAPYDLYDHFIDVGSITGNTLINIGSGLSNSFSNYTRLGFYISNQDSISISNNTIRVNTGNQNGGAMAILMSGGNNTTATVDNNDISDTCGGSSLPHYAIYANMGANGTDNLVSITNNNIHSCRYDGATTATNYYIFVGVHIYKINISGNTIRDNYVGNGSSTARRDQYGIYVSGPNFNAGSYLTISNNVIKNLRRFQSAPGVGNTYGVYILSAGESYEISGNVIDSIYNPAPGGTLTAIYSQYTAPGKLSVHDNTISNLFKESSNTTMRGIHNNNNTDTIEIYNNTIFNLITDTGMARVDGIYCFGSQADGYESIYDNTLYNLVNNSTGNTTGIFTQNSNGSDNRTINVSGNEVHDVVNEGTGQTGGIFVDGSNTGNISANRVYNIINEGADEVTYSPVYGMLLDGSASYSNYNVYNNMISEIYAPLDNSGYGVPGLWIDGGDTANIFYNTIYMDGSSPGMNSASFALYLNGNTDATLKNNILVNKFSTGTTIGIFNTGGATYNPASNNNNVYVSGGPLNIYYLDSMTLHTTFSAFQTAVAPADTNSFTENSPFMNVSSHPYNLDMKTNVATLCEGGAMPIAGITTDIHGTTRNPTMPDVGADEFNGIGPITQAPVLVYPANNAVLVEVNPLMNWDDVGSAVNYHIQLSTDSTFGSTLVDVDTVTSSQLQLGNNFLSVNTKYYWRVSGKNTLGEGPFSPIWNFTTGVTNIEPTSLPTVYELYQNYPNPFNPTTKIKFDIPKGGFVSLKVYDITGREVATLVNKNIEPSRNEVEWNGSRFASGVYFFRITAGDFVKVQKMILVK
ncbi:MAG: T9SS type A sorting domain-containing protein [Ignavibacteriae bacterium]|nr:T9SS type A sorting domain-containing protein [Ignavibacteriota bacterium]